MSDIESLSIEIQRIGKRLVRCPTGCDGVISDSSRGILPRCLILETENRTKLKGAIAVGLNPGRSNKLEREYFQKNGATYAKVLDYWHLKNTSHPYYKRTRDFLNEIGRSGPILWTELAKCESAPNSSIVPIQTYRTCVGKYLCKELSFMPVNWPLIALGKESFKALAYLYSKRVVIGIPHPTGSYIFNKLWKESGQLKARVRHICYTSLAKSAGSAIWCSVNN